MRCIDLVMYFWYTSTVPTDCFLAPDKRVIHCMRNTNCNASYARACLIICTGSDSGCHMLLLLISILL